MTSAGLRRLGGNAFWLFGAYALPRVFTTGAIVLAARVLGTEGFGVYGAAGAFAVILSILATLGMQPLLVRDLARDPTAAPRVLHAAHRVKTVVNVLMLALLYVLAGPAGGLDDGARTAAMWLGLSYAFGSYCDNIGAYFQAIEKMHVWTEASTLAGIVTGGLGALAVWLTRDVIWFCAAAAAGQAVSLGWLILRTPPEARRSAPPRAEDVARLLRALPPFAVGFLLLNFFYKLDVVLMQHWRSPTDVGLYVAGFKFVDIYQALVIVGIGALYPRLARSAPRATASPERNVRWGGTRVTEIALLVAIPVAGVLHLSSAIAVNVFFGSDYGAAAPAVAWLALALPALTVNLLGAYLLGIADGMAWVALAYAGGLVVKITLDALLIPGMGAEGAAAAMAIGETILAGAIVLALRRRAHVVPGGRTVAAACGAGGLLLVARAVPDPTGGVFASLGYLASVAAVYWMSGLFRSGVRSGPSRLHEPEAAVEMP